MINFNFRPKCHLIKFVRSSLTSYRVELGFPNDFLKYKYKATVNKTAQNFSPMQFGHCYTNITLSLEALK
jgi:hypothetical protein